MIPFKSTCYTCTERHVGCHSTCMLYKHDKEQHDILMKKANEARDANIYLSVDAIRRKNKTALAKKRIVMIRRNYR